MNTLSIDQPELPVETHATRPMYWSVRRELWESRSIYIAPLARCRRGAARLPGGHVHSAASHACPPGARSGAAEPRYRQAIQLRRGPAHRDSLHRRGVLLSRGAAWRKTRPQHPVLEVAAGFGSHDRALEGDRSAGDSAAAHLRTHRRHPGDHADDRAQRFCCWGTVPVRPMLWAACRLQNVGGLLYALIAIALWPAPLYGWLLLVSGWARRATFLWAVLPPLAIAAFERTSVPHVLCRLAAAIPAARLAHAGFRFHGAGSVLGRSADRAHAVETPMHSRSVDRADRCRDLPLRGRAAAPYPGADLMQMHS